MFHIAFLLAIYSYLLNICIAFCYNYPLAKYILQLILVFNCSSCASLLPYIPSLWVQFETKIWETLSVSGDNLCSQWVEQSASEDIIQCDNRGRATRSTNLTEKSLAYKKETLRETRRKINGRLIRKYSTIEDLLLFSSKNIIPVEKEMKQFNYLFKMLLDAHQE